MSADDLIRTLEELEAEALDRVKRASDEGTLEELRIRYLGRKKGKLSGILRGLGELDPAERPRVGEEANRIKQAVEGALDRRKGELAGALPALDASLVGEAGAPATAGAERDLTLPSRRRWRGGRHPVTRVVDEICAIFQGLGFTRAHGPEAETEWYNFVALNTPLDHPAADEQDTIYLEDGHLLRSHTSPVQVRSMEEYQPPVRIVVPGMVYRRDTWDATHAPAFTQIEGLAVDEGISFVDFKATLAEFARRFWGPGTRIRFRPSFFPFTEPSAEVDVKRVVRGPGGAEEETDWLEIMGAGMVDPAVLENVGYDPERYTGFAFGMGPERIAMLKYGVRDIREFYENDMRFLGQFSTP